MKKQVDVSHYNFGNYISKKRWASIWHQLDEVISLNPESVLELGPGPGLFKSLGQTLGLNVETLDIDPELNPDHIASVLDMPFENDAYSVVCAFQMLEHLPYEDSLKAFAEMVRIANEYVIISLPDAQPVWRFWFHIPRMGEFSYQIPFFWKKNIKHVFTGEHYWEVNKKAYELDRVITDYSRILALSGFSIKKTYRVPEFPYHRFFVMSCLQ